MARPVRIEFRGAMYHVMARGDRRERIVHDDEDRRTFCRTLDRACQRAGFRVHAYALMSNHYHLLIETPEGNLSAGMGWFQNAFTRRINVRHGLWGHLFGDRFKAIPVEPGNCFWALLDYIHLNPVRAGLVGERDGIESYPWSSLVAYISRPGRRPPWLETRMGFEVTGCGDTADGRREFLKLVQSRVDWRSPGKAGEPLRDGKAKPRLASHCHIRRGWFFGSQKFRERLLRLGDAKLSQRAGKASDGYSGAEIKDHSETEALRLLEAGRKYFGWKKREFRSLPKGDWRKGLIAGLIQERTTTRLDWISCKLDMGERSYCCRTIHRTGETVRRRRKLQKIRKEILEMSINHD